MNKDKLMEANIEMMIAVLTKQLGRPPTMEEMKQETLKMFNEAKSKVEEMKNYKPNIDIIRNQLHTNKGIPYIKSMEFLKFGIMGMLKSKGKIHLFNEKSDHNCIKALAMIETSHVFNLPNEELKFLLLKTKNNIDYRRMPFHRIFINCHLNLNNSIIYGISVIDVHSDKEDILGEEVNDKKKLNLSVFILGYDFNDNTDFYKDFYVKEKGDFINAHNKTVKNWAGEEFSLEDLRDMEEKVSLFVCNFLDFINNPEVKIITVDRIKTQKGRKVKRWKEPIKTINFIKINGQLKKYLNELKSQNAFSYSHRFWVRGHFRVLRNERYKDKVGMKIWIVPFIKGKGILIDKIYEVDKTKG